MTSPPRLTYLQAAKLLAVGPRSRRHAAIILERGVPELAHLVLAGEVRISHASVVAQLPVSFQRRAAQAGPEAVKAVAIELRKAAPPQLHAWDKAILDAEALEVSSGQKSPVSFLDLFTACQRTVAVSLALTQAAQMSPLD
ncbi:MAG: hypothetical protein HGB30_10165 [Holophagaceae bacterium]|nr:hypothetical protein [Holophagaceae bacterium]